MSLLKACKFYNQNVLVFVFFQTRLRISLGYLCIIVLLFIYLCPNGFP